MLHQPVMLEAVLEALVVKAGSIYLDGTLGRGGHAQAILQQGGRVYAIDQDPEAIAYAQQRFGGDGQPLTIRHGSFEMLKPFCDEWAITGKVSGLLLDLGVSSPQLDQAERGFSFQHDGPLDMRMDNSAGVTAAEWLASAEEKDIADVLWRFGEERYSRNIAKRIVRQRQQQPLQTTKQLADLIADASPRSERNKHPATRTFQAIRIFINRELDVLDQVLQQSLDVLKVGGRLAVISFHSLEDRIVKRFMRAQARGVELPRGLPVREGATGKTLRLLGKAMRPSDEEVVENPRARSAVLRVAERL